MNTGHRFSLDERLLTTDPFFFNICYREQQEEINLFALVCIGSLLTSKFPDIAEHPPLRDFFTEALVRSPCSVRQRAIKRKGDGNSENDR
jgi:hypothetical protein